MMGYSPYGYGNAMGGGGWFGIAIMLFFGALVAAGVVLLVVLAVRASGGHHVTGGPVQPPAPTPHDEAMAIARRRFASGELTKEQYDELVRTLGG